MSMNIPEEQILYASILYYGGLVGIGFLAVAFALYISGVMPPYVPPQELPDLWTHDTHEYLTKTGIPTGWGWIGMVTYGDIFNLLALAFLAVITIICYIAIIPALIRKRDTIYVVFAVLEIVILLLAASGVLQAGH